MQYPLKDFIRFFAHSSFLMLALSLAAAQAQTTTASANGETIGHEGSKNVTPFVGGFNPRIVTVSSIQNGDVPLIPGVPNSPLVHLEASLIGAGAARFGSLSGSLEAQARNQSNSPNFLEPYANGRILLGFLDGGIVGSDTLAPGMPVTLEFTASLASDVFTTFPVPNSRRSNYAHVTFEIEVTDTVTNTPAGTLLFNMGGFNNGPTVNFSLLTAVGNSLRFRGEMELGVGAGTAPLVNPNGDDLLATSAVIADHTAHFYYRPIPDARIISDSGHNYAISASSAAPEPGTITLLTIGGIGLFAYRRARMGRELSS